MSCTNDSAAPGRRWSARLLHLVFAAAALAAPAAATWAQGPVIGELRVQVLGMPGSIEIDEIAPGDTYEIEVGKKTLFRLVADPVNQQSRRYPSVRWEAPADNRYLSVDRANEEGGSIVVVGHRLHAPSNRGAVVLTYQVTSPLNVDDRRRQGQIYVRVAAAAEPEPEPEPVPEPVEQRLGATFYVDSEFRGRSTRLYESVRGMQGLAVGNDSISSVQVDRGCEVVLYQHHNFGGRFTVLREDAYTMRGTEVGNDEVSSIEIDCASDEDRRGGRWRDRGDRDRGDRDRRSGYGVTLYDGEDFRGTRETFERDDDYLGDNRIGQDRVRSVRVDRGCRATLYEHADYRGRSTIVDGDLATLAGTRVGLDSVSSIQVDCR